MASDVPGEDFQAQLRPHLDAIQLFCHQVATELSVTPGEIQMALDHASALVVLVGTLPDGPVRQRTIRLLDDFHALCDRYIFNPENR